MECPVCWNPYDTAQRPVTGSCGHSLCSNCASSLNGFVCPSCRRASAFRQPINNYLASDLNDQLTSSVHSLERRQNVIQDLQKQVETMNADLEREMAKADDLGNLQQENVVLKRTLEELSDRLSRSEGSIGHYKSRADLIERENASLKTKISQLENEQEGFLRREAEQERKKKERNDWDLMEDWENVPRPENAAMVLPTMQFMSDERKKQLTDLGIVLIHRADLTSRQLLTASKKQYHETVVPMVNTLVKKAAEMIV